MTTKLAHDNSETSTLSNSDWLSTSLTSSTLHNCPCFSSLCSQPWSQRFHTNHNAVDLQVPRVDQRTLKKEEEKKTSDRHHIDKKAAAEISCALRFDTRYAEPPRALVTLFAVQTSGSGTHCACVHTKCRHALRMRSHELESDARFCCKSPPPPPPLHVSASVHTSIDRMTDWAAISRILWRMRTTPVWPSVWLHHFPISLNLHHQTLEGTAATPWTIHCRSLPLSHYFICRLSERHHSSTAVSVAWQQSKCSCGHQAPRISPPRTQIIKTHSIRCKRITILEESLFSSFLVLSERCTKLPPYFPTSLAQQMHGAVVKQLLDWWNARREAGSVVQAINMSFNLFVL